MDMLAGKIEIAQSGMKAAQDSANNETKSSAGDKYETGRAMSQNERDMYAKQLTELLHQQKMLKTIDPQKRNQTVESGTLLRTEKGIFFLSVGLGLVKVGSLQVMAISPLSPIAQLILGKTTGDDFEWMSQVQTILELE
ncbi:hypothetical protein BFP72_15910 [Reichenbachiella sp. 5M10]|nr:hypothetical protein BFP72_15910 [Reichenbachiella sp. 5M10]